MLGRKIYKLFVKVDTKSNFLIMILLLLTGIYLLYTIFKIEYINPDSVLDKINQCLTNEGYDVSDIFFDRVNSSIGNRLAIYQSNRPLYYKNRNTEYWEVRRVAKLIRVYYIITPYYGEITW